MRPRNLEYTLRLDARSAALATARPEILREVSEGWLPSTRLPDHIRELLGVARELFVHAAFVYDMFTVAAAWSLFALEAALRDRLQVTADRVQLGQLIREAEDRQLVTAEDAERLHHAAKFRNMLAHPKGAMLMSPGLAQGTLEAVHFDIEQLYASSAP